MYMYKITQFLGETEIIPVRSSSKFAYSNGSFKISVSDVT